MHIDDYLHRIGLTQRPRADLAGLTAIHRAHMQSIAYENLDVQLGCAVTIERAPILEKVVDRKRGGLGRLRTSRLAGSNAPSHRFTFSGQFSFCDWISASVSWRGFPLEPLQKQF